MMEELAATGRILLDGDARDIAGCVGDGGVPYLSKRVWRTLRNSIPCPEFRWCYKNFRKGLKIERHKEFFEALKEGVDSLWRSFDVKRVQR